MGTGTENDDLTFDEIMKFYPDNRDVYEEIVENNSFLIPFVGAGLSRFCKYKTWDGALISMADGIRNQETKEKVIKNIKNDVFEGAQDLYNALGERDFQKRMSKEFSSANVARFRDNDKNGEIWKSSAAYMLPQLFEDRPVVTTNFDQILECMFFERRKQLSDILTPNSTEPQITRLLNHGTHGILKLHGSISEITNFKDLVFTDSQYKDVYSKNGKIMELLKRIFINKTLLFLGCSLGCEKYKDRTMDVFKDLTVVYKPTHYAIIGCPEEKPNKAKEFCIEKAKELRDDYGIYAIFYPNKQYDSVPTILRQLQIDTGKGGQDSTNKPPKNDTEKIDIPIISTPEPKKEENQKPETSWENQPKERIVQSIGLEMIRVNPGTFWMGSPKGELGGKSNEPQHQVTLTKGFWLGKFPVTQAQYKAVMGKNPSSFEGDNLPVEWVSWNDAIRFCDKLTEIEREAGRLPEGYKYTLPTEAQWEYACRAGTSTALNNGKNLTSGNGKCPNLDEVGWYRENSGSKTHPVGEKKPNAWGFYDMHGNVREWCLDWYGDYPTGAVIDPTGPSEGSYRVFRSGSWDHCASRGRSAFRSGNYPYSSGISYGFRAALSSC